MPQQTDEVRREETRPELEASLAGEERFRRLVEFGSELIVVVDESGTMKYVAPTVERLLGFSAAEVIGMSAFAFIHPDDLPESHERVRRVASRPGAREQATIRLRTAGGEWRTFEISNVNMLDDPHVRGLIINGHDITATTRLAEELAQMRRVESLGRVAAAVAHEFNNILSAADAFTTVLVRKKDPSLESIAQGLKSAVTRGKQITTRILEYGQPAAVLPARIDVPSWLRDLRQELEPILAGRNPISLELADDLPPLYGDRALLTPVLTNLVLNARDASSPGAPIAIAARTGSKGEVVLEVIDTGTGIPPETIDHIFEPLFTTRRNGTGLGLAVVQQIVMRHGGRVVVRSEPGHGSTFTVTLPAAKAGDAAGASDARRG